ERHALHVVQAGFGQRLAEPHLVDGADWPGLDLETFARPFLVDFHPLGQVAHLLLLGNLPRTAGPTGPHLKKTTPGPPPESPAQRPACNGAMRSTCMDQPPRPSQARTR